MAPCDVASNILGRHVIQRTLNSRVLSQMAPCDVASTIHQALPNAARGLRAAHRVLRGSGRGLHSSPSHLNLSRSCH